MQEEDIKALLDKYKTGTITDAEKAILDEWYLHVAADRSEELSDEERLKTFDHVLTNLNEVIYARKTRRLWPRIAAAASILIALSVCSYFVLHKKPVQQVAQNIVIKPGSNKAILTLSNGQRIVLTDAKNGKVAQQGNTIINKTADGKVAYQANSTGQPAEVQYNILTTPRGGRYEATLADGTHFILDAGSSIRYPVNFTANERLVEITGQVFFEVTHDAAKPFKVKVKGQVIEDLGTVFNINAYDDEPVIRTTLVQGSVKVAKNDQSAILKPGQQAITQQDKNDIKVSSANIDDVIAWKNGQTSFEGENVQEIMRQVSRWYDVDVEYEGTLTPRHFTGGIPRNANFSDLVRALEFENIHVTVEGKKLLVKP